uniref:Uncharacterized protein n=1 Tax=Cyclopterus lumpus TaxID=8103 RepID=A0A8C2WHR1_CYCLU
MWPQHGSERARMTLPRASRPVLIWTDSLRRVPVFPVFPARSEPARSTRQSLEERTDCKEESVRMAALPVSRTLSSSSAEVTTTSLAPTTTENTNHTTQ